MDGLFELIILALFILTSILGGRKKEKRGPKSKGKPSGEGRASGPGRARGRAAGADRPPARAGAGGERDSAATMVPDDLWTVLTGERPSPPRAAGGEGGASDGARGAPVPAGGAHEVEQAAEREPGGRSTSSDPIPWDDEAQSLESIPEPEYPRVVSLEERPLPREVRRHLTLEQVERRADALPQVQRRRRRLPFGLDDRDAVRRAVVLREVLGPPKGLQP